MTWVERYFGLLLCAGIALIGWLVLLAKAGETIRLGRTRAPAPIHASERTADVLVAPPVDPVAMPDCVADGVEWLMRPDGRCYHDDKPAGGRGRWRIVFPR